MRKNGQQIYDTLLELGMPCHIKGYRYTVYALELSLENPDILDAVTKELYPAVAEKFETSVSRVERAIRHAIEVVWDRGDLGILHQYFGNTVSGRWGKPTNAEFLALVTTRIKMGIA